MSSCNCEQEYMSHLTLYIYIATSPSGSPAKPSTPTTNATTPSGELLNFILTMISKLIYSLFFFFFFAILLYIEKRRSVVFILIWRPDKRFEFFLYLYFMTKKLIFTFVICSFIGSNTTPKSAANYEIAHFGGSGFVAAIFLGLIFSML